MKEQIITWTARRLRPETHPQRFLTLLEGTADPAFAVDLRGLISAWNTAATELFGLTESEAINHRCHDVLQCSDENDVLCSTDCVVERAARENHPRGSFDLRVQTKTRRLWCNVSTLIASDELSGVRNAICIVRPIEIWKRLEQALSEFVRLQGGSSSIHAPVIRLAPTARGDARLTSREVEVLRSLSAGHSTRAIAHQLNISSATVSNHIKHILTKLDVHTRLEAIRHAERNGVI